MDRGQCNRHELKKQPIKEGQEILIVIGEDLKEDKIRECLEDKCTEGAENE